jgi:hypothetical protein
VAVAVAAAFALIVVAFLPFRIADVIVAFAPGAQDTMMVLALLYTSTLSTSGRII